MDMKKVWMNLGVAIGVAVILAFDSLRQSCCPFTREVIVTPIYTLGDSSYERALTECKKIVKFGPLLGGLYPGGIAFRTPAAAAAYRDQKGWRRDRWGIYQLSGDYAQDVKQGHIDKALFVLRHVPESVSAE